MYHHLNAVRSSLLTILLLLGLTGCMLRGTAGTQNVAHVAESQQNRVTQSIKIPEQSPPQPWEQALDKTKTHSISGNVKLIKDFSMSPLQKNRNVWIYLPPGYENSDERYPVLYMQDAQNVFDTATSFAHVEWGVDEYMEKFAASGSEQKLAAIVVAVENGGQERTQEYLPARSDFDGQGEEYATFLAKTLKPYIDEHYRTLPDRQHTMIAGSSLGGYISIYTGLLYPELFGKIAAFSTVYGFDGGYLLEFIEQSTRHDLRIYLDIGAKEEEQFPNVVEDNRGLREKLLPKGFQDQNVKLVIDPDGVHQEGAWNKRFGDAFRWLMSGPGN